MNNGILSRFGANDWNYRDFKTCISCGFLIQIIPRITVGFHFHLGHNIAPFRTLAYQMQFCNGKNINLNPHKFNWCMYDSKGQVTAARQWSGFESRRQRQFLGSLKTRSLFFLNYMSLIKYNMLLLRRILIQYDPRFLTHWLGLIRLLPTVMEHESNLSSCRRVATNKNSVSSHWSSTDLESSISSPRQCIYP